MGETSNQIFKSDKKDWDLAYSAFSGENMLQVMAAFTLIKSDAVKANEEIANAGVEDISTFDDVLQSKDITELKDRNRYLCHFTHDIQPDVKNLIDDPFGTAVSATYDVITMISGHGLIDGSETITDDIKNILAGFDTYCSDVSVYYRDSFSIREGFGIEFTMAIDEMLPSVKTDGFYMWEINGYWFSFSCRDGKLYLTGVTPTTDNMDPQKIKLCESINSSRWCKYNLEKEYKNNDIFGIYGWGDTAIVGNVAEDAVNDYTGGISGALGKFVKGATWVIGAGLNAAQNVVSCCYDEYGNWNPTAANIQRSVTDTIVDLTIGGIADMAAGSAVETVAVSVGAAPETGGLSVIAGLTAWVVVKSIELLDESDDNRKVSDDIKDGFDNLVDTILFGATR